MPTAGRHGASPGLSLRASSIFTYSAVARVSSSASTRPPKGRTLVCNADPGRPLLLGHGFRSAGIPWNYSSRLPRPTRAGTQWPVGNGSTRAENGPCTTSEAPLCGISRQPARWSHFEHGPCLRLGEVSPAVFVKDVVEGQPPSRPSIHHRSENRPTRRDLARQDLPPIILQARDEELLVDQPQHSGLEGASKTRSLEWA